MKCVNPYSNLISA